MTDLKHSRPAYGRGLVLALALMAGLAACQTPPPRAFPQITFADRSPIELNVARVDVVEAYQSPGGPTHVEWQLPEAPTTILQRWADQRLRAVGTDGVARVIIQDASLIEEPLATRSGPVGWFRLERSERYTGRFAVRVEAERGALRGSAEAVAQRSATVIENATLAERESTLFALTENAVRDLDGELDRNIRQYLGAFVVR